MFEKSSNSRYRVLDKYEFLDMLNMDMVKKHCIELFWADAKQGSFSKTKWPTFQFRKCVCGLVGALDKDKELHGEIEKEEFLEKDVLISNALVDMCMSNVVTSFTPFLIVSCDIQNE